jgi:hypothetical protein
MKPSDEDAGSCVLERERKIRGPWELVRLYANEPHDHDMAGAPCVACEAVDSDRLYGVIENPDLPRSCACDGATLADLFRERREAGECVTGKEAFAIAQDVAVVIVL